MFKKNSSDQIQMIELLKRLTFDIRFFFKSSTAELKK